MPPVKDHRATGMIERTIGSINNYVLTYLREDKNQKYGMMTSRTLSVLRFIPHSKIKLTPFEAYHGREGNTAFRNLTKKPSLKYLNWKNAINHKIQCLDEASGLLEVELNLDCEKRSDLVYALQNRKTPRVLEEHELAEADVKLTHPGAPEWLKRHKTRTTAV